MTQNPAKTPASSLLVPAGAHVLGNPEAPVTIVEFADLECPWCRDTAPVLHEAVERSEGQVRLVWRHFPLFSVHPHALTAALAAEVAGASGLFWAMEQRLFAHQDRLTDADLVEHAAAIGVPDPGSVVGEAAQTSADVVRRDYADGLAAGVEGTPTVFVNGMRCRGRITRDRLQDAVAQALAAG
ncbi:DsbA family protein [Antribacter gilvus]|uniref:DsbA family protein n=1 Tax=Antribacter gilvus TaxID=2304675 RepID=UPI000F76FAEF|nr:DsbA family protein [Antribacter gilvus]